MKVHLGEFEELVLLTIASLDEDAYGVRIKEHLLTLANRSVSIGALHATITRLEEKGYLDSWTGGATKERGGRKKRYFKLTTEGIAALHHSKSLRESMWSSSKINLSTHD